MQRQLNWVDVLNDQATWKSKADLINWFCQIVGRPAHLPDGAIEAFEESLGYMRRQLANLHFGEPVDLLWLDTQLKTVSFGLLHHQGAQEGPESCLPRLRARVKGLQDSDLLRSVKDTLLLQFAGFVGAALDDKDSISVARCEGLYRDTPSDSISAAATYPEDVEARWREEVPVLNEHRESAEDILRCGDFFPATPKGKFCSDACRFSTFQIAKQIQEPGYLAEKQRRYRRKTTTKNVDNDND
jgi:hypothetical protein